jgi:hypothetical protein
MEKAKSSKVALRLDLVPECFIRRVAERFTLGAENYGEYNYRKGITDEKFIQERINHLKLHLSNFFIRGYADPDDNLSAVASGVAMLMEFEASSAGKLAIQNVLNRMNNVPMVSDVLYDAIADIEQAIRGEQVEKRNKNARS